MSAIDPKTLQVEDLHDLVKELNNATDAIIGCVCGRENDGGRDQLFQDALGYIREVKLSLEGARPVLQEGGAS